MGFFDKKVKQAKRKINPPVKRSGFGGGKHVAVINGQRKTFTGNNAAWEAQRAVQKANEQRGGSAQYLGQQ